MNDESAFIQLVESYISKGKTPKEFILDASKYWEDSQIEQLRRDKESFNKMIRQTS